jgi:2-polyprenyl-3-methyl-5-hydroxy-6-metoxy-1,4-benzoquinol methylase
MEAEITYQKCLCCGSIAVDKAVDCIDYTVSNKSFEVWQCANCTFRFTQQVPDAAHIGVYYQSENYISHSDTQKGLVNTLYHRVRKFTLKTKAALVKKVTGLAQGNLLDVGAGTGAFAHTMQQGGWHLTALEPDDTARQNALSNYKIQLDEPVKLFSLPGSQFDAITMWHVLEHVHDLAGYLERFKIILKPDGRLIVAVPNHTSHDAAVYQQFWAAYDVPRHLYHFSPESMKQLLSKHGFVVEKMKPMWFDSFYVSMLSEKYKNGRSNFLKAMWVGLISNLKAVVDSSKCSSVIYIIRHA